MERVLLNNELELTCPEGFRVLSEEEMNKFSFPNEKPGCILENQDSHITVSLAWRPINGLLALLVNVRELAQKMAQYVSEADQPYDHRQSDCFTGSVAGEKSAGFDYHYKAQDIDMDGRAIVVRHRRTLYYMYFYSRSALREPSLKLIDEIISSMNFK
ncbi:MAG: hypothetical protein J5887_00480 [Erysipelotrichaceae bacterium]|nr:hypothetical protein [Erysipelotrichaceae bacterium]